MKEYYIAVDGQQKGAFSLKELKQETVLPDTLMWKEGWDNWQKAKDVAQTIPEIDLIINDTPPISQESEATAPKPKKNLLVTLAKASEGDLGSLGSLVGIGGKKDSKEEEDNEGEVEPAKDKPSFVSIVYHAIGDKLDSFITNNKEVFGSNALFIKLEKARNFYKGLSINKQRSFTFMLTAFLLAFPISFITIGDPNTPFYGAFFYVVVYYSAFVALNQIKIIDDTINKIVDFISLLDFGLMPAMLKRAIARGAKFLILLLIIFWLGVFIGLPYFIYRAVIPFINTDNFPDLENR